MFSHQSFSNSILSCHQSSEFGSRTAEDGSETAPEDTVTQVQGQLVKLYVDDLMQDCSNSSAVAVELLQSCSKSSLSC